MQKNDKKRKKTTSRHGRKKAGAIAGIAKKYNAAISVDIPGGYVTGDRVFDRDLETKKAIYCDIEYGKHGIWRDVGRNSVLWGEGDGGVWVHTKRAPRNVYGWEILKMDAMRMQDLYDRSLKKVKANKKPVKFPHLFVKLVQERYRERLAKDEAMAAVETQHAEKKRAITAMTSGMGREEGAKSQLVDLRVHQRAEIADESKDMASVREAREEMRVALDKAIAEATTEAGENCLLQLDFEEEKNTMASENGLPNAHLDDMDEQLRVAEEEVYRLKAETANPMVDRKHVEASSERYKNTFGVEAAETPCIEPDCVSDLPPILLDIHHSVKHTQWAVWEDEGHSKRWPGPAFARLLDLRNR